MEKPNLDEFYHVFTSRAVKIHGLLHDEGDGSMCEKLERIQDKLFREFREEFCEGTVPPTWLEDRESCIHVFQISTAMTNLRFRINFLNAQLQVQRNKIDLTRCMIGRCFGRVQLKKSSSMLRDSKKQKIIGFKFRRGMVKKKLWRWVELTNARSELYRINKLIFWEIASIFLDALIFHYSLSCVQLVHFTDKLDYGVIVFVHSIYPFTKAIGMTAKYDELENFVVTDAKNRRIPLFREEDVPVWSFRDCCGRCGGEHF